MPSTVAAVHQTRSSSIRVQERRQGPVPEDRPLSGSVKRQAVLASSAARVAIADLRFAAWFLWMMPLLAALSRARVASRASSWAFAASPASAASRNLRTEVFRADLTDLLRRRAASLVRLRLIYDLIFATKLLRLRYAGRASNRSVVGHARVEHAARHARVPGRGSPGQIRPYAVVAGQSLPRRRLATPAG